jgi:hypothetical protein
LFSEDNLVTMILEPTSEQRNQQGGEEEHL